MDAAAIAGLCALLARGDLTQSLPAGVTCPTAATATRGEPSSAMESALRIQVTGPEAREAIARVAYAEAGNQGDSGLAGVVFVVILISLVCVDAQLECRDVFCRPDDLEPQPVRRIAVFSIPAALSRTWLDEIRQRDAHLDSRIKRQTK